MLFNRSDSVMIRESLGTSLENMVLRPLTQYEITRLYREHKDKKFYTRLVKFMSLGNPVTANAREQRIFF